jgi:hypothetical protein
MQFDLQWYFPMVWVNKFLFSLCYVKLVGGFLSPRTWKSLRQLPSAYSQYLLSILLPVDRIFLMLLSKLKMKGKRQLKSWNGIRCLRKRVFTLHLWNIENISANGDQVPAPSFPQLIGWRLGEDKLNPYNVGSKYENPQPLTAASEFFPPCFMLLTSIFHSTEIKGIIWTLRLVHLFDKYSSLRVPLCIF